MSARDDQQQPNISELSAGLEEYSPCDSAGLCESLQYGPYSGTAHHRARQQAEDFCAATGIYLCSDKQSLLARACFQVLQGIETGNQDKTWNSRHLITVVCRVARGKTSSHCCSERSTQLAFSTSSLAETVPQPEQIPGKSSQQCRIAAICAEAARSGC